MMADHETPADVLVREVEKLLAPKPGIAAFRTARCPSLPRCAEVFTVPTAGWTPREVQHFRACPYCYGVGHAFIKASRELAPLTQQRAPSVLEAIANALRKLVPGRGD
jgi:hypothetical protein